MHLLLQDLNNMDMKSAAVGAAFGAALIGILVFVSLFAIFTIVCHWIIFTKAGKPGWACIVPIYNTIVLLEIVGKPWWWLFILWTIIPAIIVINRLSKSFGQGAGFTVGLLFVPLIFYPILAFSKSMQYIGPGGVAPSATAAN